LDFMDSILFEDRSNKTYRQECMKSYTT
jgi:hypothetical protein